MQKSDKKLQRFSLCFRKAFNILSDFATDPKMNRYAYTL